MLDQDVRGDARERVDERANRRRLLRGRLHRDERVKRADAGGFPAWNRGPIVGRDRGHGASPFRGLRLEGRLRAFDASRERLRAFLRRRRPRLRVGQSRLRRRRPRLRVGDSHLRRLRPRRRRVQRAFRRLETFRIRRFERARASRESSKRVAAGGFPAWNRGPIVEYAAAGVGGGLVAKHQSRGAVAALAEVLVHDDVQRVAFGVVRGRKGGGGGRRRVPEDILEQAGGIAIDSPPGVGTRPGRRGMGRGARRGERAHPRARARRARGPRSRRGGRTRPRARGSRAPGFERRARERPSPRPRIPRARRGGTARGRRSRRGARRALRRRARRGGHPRSNRRGSRSRARHPRGLRASREGRGTARTRRARGRAGGGTRRQTPRPPRDASGAAHPRSNRPTASRRPEPALRTCASDVETRTRASDRRRRCAIVEVPRIFAVVLRSRRREVPRASKARVANAHDTRG